MLPRPLRPQYQRRSGSRRSKKEKNINQVLAGKAVKVGDRGGAVRNVQKRLNNAGIITPITGRYTNSTSKAVSRFQGKFFWGSTGRVNAATYITLRKLTRHGSGVPAACRNASKIICIDKTQKIVRFYQNGNLKRSLDARFGAPGTLMRARNFRVNSSCRTTYRRCTEPRWTGRCSSAGAKPSTSPDFSCCWLQRSLTWMCEPA